MFYYGQIYLNRAAIIAYLGVILVTKLGFQNFGIIYVNIFGKNCIYRKIAAISNNKSKILPASTVFSQKYLNLIFVKYKIKFVRSKKMNEENPL